MLFILLLVFIGITLIQLVYYVFIFGRFSFAKKQTIQPKKLPISIIICAKNEEENVKRYVESLSFANEIIFIDSSSNDKTIEYTKEMGVKVIERALINFSEQLNDVIQQAKNDWIKEPKNVR